MFWQNDNEEEEDPPDKTNTTTTTSTTNYNNDKVTQQQQQHHHHHHHQEEEDISCNSSIISVSENASENPEEPETQKDDDDDEEEEEECEDNNYLQDKYAANNNNNATNNSLLSSNYESNSFRKLKLAIVNTFSSHSRSIPIEDDDEDDDNKQPTNLQNDTDDDMEKDNNDDNDNDDNDDDEDIKSFEDDNNDNDSIASENSDINSDDDISSVSSNSTNSSSSSSSSDETQRSLQSSRIPTSIGIGGNNHRDDHDDDDDDDSHAAPSYSPHEQYSALPNPLNMFGAGNSSTHSRRNLFRRSNSLFIKKDDDEDDAAKRDLLTSSSTHSRLSCRSKSTNDKDKDVDTSSFHSRKLNFFSSMKPQNDRTTNNNLAGDSRSSSSSTHSRMSVRNNSQTLPNDDSSTHSRMSVRKNSQTLSNDDSSTHSRMSVRKNSRTLPNDDSSTHSRMSVRKTSKKQSNTDDNDDLMNSSSTHSRMSIRKHNKKQSDDDNNDLDTNKDLMNSSTHSRMSFRKSKKQSDDHEKNDLTNSSSTHSRMSFRKSKTQTKNDDNTNNDLASRSSSSSTHSRRMSFRKSQPPPKDDDDLSTTSSHSTSSKSSTSSFRKLKNKVKSKIFSSSSSSRDKSYDYSNSLDVTGSCDDDILDEDFDDDEIEDYLFRSGDAERVKRSLSAHHDDVDDDDDDDDHTSAKREGGKKQVPQKEVPTTTTNTKKQQRRLSDTFIATNSANLLGTIGGAGTRKVAILEHNNRRHIQKNSFFADSPYYNTFMKEELNSLQLVSETLQDICKQTKEFALAGTAMAKSARKLATSCQLRSTTGTTTNTTNAYLSSTSTTSRSSFASHGFSSFSEIKEEDEDEDGEGEGHKGKLKNTSDDSAATQSEEEKQQRERKKEILGTHLTSILGHVGEMLIQIASLQEHMCSVVQTTLGPDIEDMTSKHIDRFNFLKEDVEHQTENAEKLFFRYLQNNSIEDPFASTNDGDFSSSNNIDTERSLSSNLGKRNDSLVAAGEDDNKNKMRSIKKFGASVRVKKNSSINSSNTAVGKDNNTENEISKETLQTMHKVRMEQGVAEFKRILLCKRSYDARFQRFKVMSDRIEEFCNELQNYHILSSEILKNTTSKVQENNDESRMFLRDYDNNMEFKWQEKISHEILHKMNLNAEDKPSGNDDNDNNSSCSSDSDDSTSSFANEVGDARLSVFAKKKPTSSLEKAEKKVGIWDIPTSVASNLPYIRELPQGVKIEGWLYEQNQQQPVVSSKEKRESYKKTRFGMGFLSSKNKLSRQFSDTLSSSSSWKKRWCILKNDGLFCLRERKATTTSGEEETELSYFSQRSGDDFDELSWNNGLYLKKICDVVDLRGVKKKETPLDDISNRFHFEITLSQQKQKDGENGSEKKLNDGNLRSITFQASGPKELNSWISGIKSVLIKSVLNTSVLNG